MDNKNTSEYLVSRLNFIENHLCSLEKNVWNCILDHMLEHKRLDKPKPEEAKKEDAPKCVDFPTAIKALIYDKKKVSLEKENYRTFVVHPPSDGACYYAFTSADLLSQKWVIE